MTEKEKAAMGLLYDANYDKELFDAERRNKGLEYAYPIAVGSNVWIGSNTIVLPGVTIGDNTVIGAGSVVTKNIPAGVIAFGNPCKVIREITQLPEFPCHSL